MWWEITLRYLTVLLTWPVVALALGLVVVVRYGRSMGLLLDRICTLRVGNVVEMSMQQSSAPEMPTDREKQIINVWTEAEVERAQAEQDKGKLLQQLQNMQLQAAFWQFQYLNVFLVPKTKLFLEMLTMTEPPMTLQTFRTVWPSWNWGDENERETVLVALMNNSLVEQQDDRLVVTDKGHAFLQFWKQTLANMAK